MRQKIRRGVVLAALVVALGTSAHPARTLAAGYVEEKIGFMTHPDFERYNRIEAGVERTGRLSDTDLDWLIRLMAKSPPTPSEVNKDIVHDQVMIVFREVKSPPRAQEEKMYQAVSPLLSSDRFRQRAVAARVMGFLGDRRAVPALRRLRNDADPAVRGAAGRSLRSMGLS